MITSQQLDIIRANPSTDVTYGSTDRSKFGTRYPRRWMENHPGEEVAVGVRVSDGSWVEIVLPEITEADLVAIREAGWKDNDLQFGKG